MKKKPFRAFKIPVPLYKLDLQVILSKDREKCRDFSNKYFGGEYFSWDVPINGRVMSNNGIFIVLWLPQFPKTPPQIAEMVHELLHVCCRILQPRGMELKEESEEAYTYLLEYLVTEFLKHK